MEGNAEDVTDWDESGRQRSIRSEPESQMITSCLGPGNQTKVLWKRSGLLSAEPSLYHLQVFFHLGKVSRQTEISPKPLFYQYCPFCLTGMKRILVDPVNAPLLIYSAHLFIGMCWPLITLVFYVCWHPGCPFESKLSEGRDQICSICFVWYPAKSYRMGSEKPWTWTLDIRF